MIKTTYFVGKRKDNPGNKWQMPQGGINEGRGLCHSDEKRVRSEETSIKNIKILKEINQDL